MKPSVNDRKHGLVWVSMGWLTNLFINSNSSKLFYSWQSRKGFIGNIQGDSRKFLGHFKCHFGPQISSESNRSSKWSQHLQQKWLIQSVNGWVDQLFYWHQHSGSMQGYSEIRSRSNVWKEHTHIEGHIYDYTHFLLQILGLLVSYINIRWILGCKKKT